MFTSITSFTAIALINALAHLPVEPVIETTPRLLASCESPVQGSWRPRQASLDSNPALQVVANQDTARVSLVQSGAGFSLHFEYPVSDSPSVVRVEGIQLDEHSFHIILDKQQGAPEHFLFNLGLDGSGDLLWSSADASVMTACSGLL